MQIQKSEKYEQDSRMINEAVASLDFQTCFNNFVFIKAFSSQPTNQPLEHETSTLQTKQNKIASKPREICQWGCWRKRKKTMDELNLGSFFPPNESIISPKCNFEKNDGWMDGRKNGWWSCQIFGVKRNWLSVTGGSWSMLINCPKTQTIDFTFIHQ